MFKTLALTTCTLLLLTTGCKKKDEAKTADPSMEAKPGETKPAEKPTEMKPAMGGTITNAADYEAKANDMMDKMTALFVADGKDCDKLAADMSAFLDTNKDGFAATKTFETANPDAKKALDTKMEPRMKDFQAKAGPSLDACKDNKALQAAMSKMPQ